MKGHRHFEITVDGQPVRVYGSPVMSLEARQALETIVRAAHARMDELLARPTASPSRAASPTARPRTRSRAPRARK